MFAFTISTEFKNIVSYFLDSELAVFLWKYYLAPDQGMLGVGVHVNHN